MERRWGWWRRGEENGTTGERDHRTTGPRTTGPEPEGPANVEQSTPNVEPKSSPDDASASCARRFHPLPTGADGAAPSSGIPSHLSMMSSGRHPRAAACENDKERPPGPGMTRVYIAARRPLRDSAVQDSAILSSQGRVAAFGPWSVVLLRGPVVLLTPRSELRAVRSLGPLVPWSLGPLVLLTPRCPVLWSLGPLVPWSLGPSSAAAARRSRRDRACRPCPVRE